jgi:hypothetical protein
MKRGLAAAVGFFVVLAGLGLAGGGKAPAIAFSLIERGVSPAPISFTLARRSTEPGAPAAPGGSDLIEDAASPFRTAVGYEALKNNTTGIGNTALGFNALLYDFSGLDNTATGYHALRISTGSFNTASGSNAMSWNTGSSNTAVGYSALSFNGLDDGPSDYNTAVGTSALIFNMHASYNTAIGADALASNDYGSGNTAVGYKSLETGGSFYDFPYNTALGYKAGSELFTGPGNQETRYNICIGANQTGQDGDSNTIRIGLPYTASTREGQNRTFIAGIVESPLASGDMPAIVGITGAGRLGTIAATLLPAGEGLVPGSLLLLPAGVSPPPGYSLLGATQLQLRQKGGKTTPLTINVYQKK